MVLDYRFGDYCFGDVGFVLTSLASRRIMRK